MALLLKLPEAIAVGPRCRIHTQPNTRPKPPTPARVGGFLRFCGRCQTAPATCLPLDPSLPLCNHDVGPAGSGRAGTIAASAAFALRYSPYARCHRVRAAMPFPPLPDPLSRTLAARGYAEP